MTNLRGPGEEDAFGKLIADNTRNKLDIASHYPYNPERWRIFVDGSRVFPEYNSVSQYNHAADVHELTPAAGETVVMATAERPRYVVQYELASSWAFNISQSLQSGDKIKIGMFDGNDGWFFEHTDSASDDKDGTFVTLRNGSRVQTADVSLSEPVTTFTRFLLRSNWYNVGRQELRQSYTQNNGTQENDIVSTMSREDGRGPHVGNLPIRYEVTAGSGTSNLTLNAGSVASVTLGDTAGLNRTKVSAHTETISTTGSWVPILALRADSDRDIVNTQLNSITVDEFSGSNDIRLIAAAHGPSQVQDSNGNTLTDSNYSVPPEHHAENSVLEVSSDVAQASDNTGTVTTSTSRPGGFQIGYGALYATGSGPRQTERTITPSQNRPIFGRDTVVIWANAAATGDVTFEIISEQDW